MAKRGRKKGRRRSTRRKRGGKKPVQRGILGKLGALVMGVGPPVVAALDVAADLSVHAKKGATMPSLANKGFLRWLNNLTFGFTGKLAFDKSVTMTTKDGSTYESLPGTGLPAGSLLTVVGTGGLMMLADYATSYLTGNRAVKIIGTNMTATGTR